jgi:hypothetical protein
MEAPSYMNWFIFMQPATDRRRITELHWFAGRKTPSAPARKLKIFIFVYMACQGKIGKR